MRLIIILSSGRSGSTFVTRMLHAHPDVLSVSELFFRKVVRRGLTDAAPIPGALFWSRLDRPSRIIDAAIGSGMTSREFIYPYATGRFRPPAPTPGILHMTLPALSTAPDDLYDDLASAVPRWPARAVADHHRALFAWLRDRYPASVVVERTGGSLRYARDLVAAFPEAKFVYLHRDPVDTILSMSRYLISRLNVTREEALRILGVASLREAPTAPAALRDQARTHLEILTPPYRVPAVTDLPLPLTAFAARWKQATELGLAALRDIPAHRLAVMRYEDYCARPRTVFTALSRYLGVAAPDDWLDHVTRSVRPPATPGPNPEDLTTIRTASRLPLPEPTLV